jgi:hypothetical protein
MNGMNRRFGNYLAVIAILGLVISTVLGLAAWANADPAGTAKDSSLPPSLFLKTAPPDAIGVSEARKTAEEGKPIVMRGKVGGTAKPIADKYAMFLVTDLSIVLCKDACADFCHIPREQLMISMATVQVVDATGKPLKVPIEGINGLKPLSEVVVKGTVAKRDNNFLVVNAHNIFVESGAK